jgi:hypothetical protein
MTTVATATTVIMTVVETVFMTNTVPDRSFLSQARVSASTVACPVETETR